MRIISLDPGGTTGWACYTESQLASYVYNVNDFTYGQLGPHEHHKELYDLLRSGIEHDYRIVCESFEYRNESRSGLVLVSREYIGVVKLFCQETLTLYFPQTASVGKITGNSFVQPANLARLGLWAKGGKSRMNHAMDAVSHLLQYMVKNNIHKKELLEKGWK